MIRQANLGQASKQTPLSGSHHPSLMEQQASGKQRQNGQGNTQVPLYAGGLPKAKGYNPGCPPPVLPTPQGYKRGASRKDETQSELAESSSSFANARRFFDGATAKNAVPKENKPAHPPPVLPKPKGYKREATRKDETQSELAESSSSYTNARRLFGGATAKNAVPDTARPSVVGVSKTQWLDGSGRKAYDQSTSQTIRDALENGTTRPPVRGGGSYTINPSTLVQTNQTTWQQRKIRCQATSQTSGGVGQVRSNGAASSSSSSSSGQWQYRQSNGGLANYLPSANAKIEKAHQCHQRFVDLTILSWQYQLDLEENYQINVKTGSRRELRHVPTVTKENRPIQHVAPEASLGQASKRMPLSDSHHPNLVEQHSSGKQCQNGQGSTQTRKIVQSVGSTDAVGFPEVWKLPCEGLELVPVGSFSDEFTTIEGRIQETLPNASIDLLQRIQNKFLWRKFVQNRQEIREVNGTSTTPKEKLLFHGTRQTEPEKVYRSQEGFDMRFSASGLWGRANYFAEDAAYSHDYSHKVVAGMKQQRQMLLALVTVGESKGLAKDGQLTRPPIRIPGGSQVHGDILYDTVNGITNQRRVYMTYNNRQAYPFYLITYSNTSPGDLDAQSRPEVSLYSPGNEEMPVNKYLPFSENLESTEAQFTE